MSISQQWMARLIRDRASFNASTVFQHILEYSLYIYVFSLFRSTTLRIMATTLLLTVFIAKAALTRGTQLRYLRHPVYVLLAIFLSLSLISVAYSSGPAQALYEYGQTLGMVGLLAVVLPYVIRDEKTLRRFLLVAGFTALFLNYVQIGGIVREFRSVGALLQDVSYHRSHSASIIFYLPFLLALAHLETGWRSTWWWCLSAFQGVMLAATAGRAAMLSAAIGLIVWAWFRLDKKSIVFAVLSLVLIGLFIWALPNHTFIHTYIEHGLSASGRLELTWGPTSAMIVQEPILGYGYGSFVYSEQYDRQISPSALPQYEWGWVRQLGPHNYYLETWFASGVVALTAMILLFARYFSSLIRFIPDAKSLIVQNTAIAAVMAFTVHYLVHAHFGPLGPTGLRPLGVLLGLGIAVLLINADYWRSEKA